MSAANVRQAQVTVDCADPGALALFWCEVLGYRIEPPPPGFDSWDQALETWGVPAAHRNDRSAAGPPDGADGFRLFFQKVPEAKTAKNRLHLDVRAAPGLESEERMAALEAECERLVVLGATRVERIEAGSPASNGHLVMRDPEGNEFCLD